MSAMALAIAGVTGYFQYQSRLDAIEERVKIELKMAYEGRPLNPLDLRMISGVEERENLETAILITNVGSTSVRILEAGYYPGLDLPIHAFYVSANEAKEFSPGEQAIFLIPDLMKVERQLLGDIRLGDEPAAEIFAVSTRGNRFTAPPMIEVAK